jgi:hypothetical protein
MHGVGWRIKTIENNALKNYFSLEFFRGMNYFAIDFSFSHWLEVDYF